MLGNDFKIGAIQFCRPDGADNREFVGDAVICCFHRFTRYVGIHPYSKRKVGHFSDIYQSNTSSAALKGFVAEYLAKSGRIEMAQYQEKV
ncbi:hypothetical protein L6J37_13450 [Photobacterium sp. WH77]|uniref:Uncharacterized protein n=1 Tax=Photobacterium arenosum TaxID=2774143 RepID=A0ABR9BLM4_9GAMM|nr:MULTISPECIES: hypothetical protein [Photobacterium]MBD8513467.1 hypothetical protein [Photobacterium arenosum]MBV7262709.1 hypothetical protein [Photobacterium sp. WH24]MCG2837837.1 hypothetical protein [Photobacterium sp. WH77]MCG2845454.1 hypothetical protein [Photobacterium sp. WH80]